MSKFTDQVKEHPMIAGAVGIMALLSGVNVTTVIQGVRFVDGIASKEYVREQITAFSAQTDRALSNHVRVANESMAGLEDKLDRIQAFTEVVPELKNLLTLRCMGTPNLDPTIERLEGEYQRLTRETFQEPSCDKLVSIGP